nr:reverse transcriptase domain-containing protein [Tanacetum cinerariifolium]
IDWLCNHKAEIICHDKVVRIPLPDDKVLRVIGERPEEKMRHLMSAKAKEQKPEEIVVVRDFPKVNSKNSKTRDSFDQARRLREHRNVINGDGIHVDPSKIETVKNWEAPRTPSKVRSFLESKTFDWGEEQEREFQTLKDKLCNTPVLALYDGLEDFVVYCDASGLGLGCVLMQRGKVIAYASRFWQSIQEALGARLDMSTAYHPQTEGQRPELMQETTKKISQINDRLKAVSDHQKSYADKRIKPLEFSVGEYVLLKVSPWKGVVRFMKKVKLAPRFVGSFEIIERIGLVAYRLDLPEELDGVHDKFHVSNLKKCLANPTLQVLLDEIRVDAKLNFVEEPVEILERDLSEVELPSSRFGEIRNMDLNSRGNVKTR